MDKRLTRIKRFKLLTPAGPFFAGIAAVRKENERRQTGHLLNERIVYSYLAYRARTNTGSTINELVRETTLHKQTVNNALSNLIDLAHLHDGQWHANEPPDGWFSADDSLKGDHWSDKLRYVTLFIPAKREMVGAADDRRRFGLNHAVVFSYIVSFTKRANPTTRLSVKLLCRLLGMNPKTVSRILSDLQLLGIISCDEVGIRLDLNDEHLAFFQVQTAKAKQPETTNGPARPESNKYEFKKDGFDEYRRVCEPLMPQGHAETAIDISQHLGLDLPAFEDRLATAKAISDSNVQSGKCSYPNLGKFFVNSLQQTLQHRERIESEVAEEERLKEQVNSPAFKQKMAEWEEGIKADPMHRCHLLTVETVTDRVRFSEDGFENRRKAEGIRKRVLMHCRHFFSVNRPANGSVSEHGKVLYERVLKQALKQLNGYYQQDVRATGDQLKQAIDAVLAEIDGMKTLFNVNDEAKTNRTCA